MAVSYILIEALDYYLIEMAANPNSDDVGIKDRSAFGAGTFAIPSTCDPKTPGQKEAGSQEGSSGDLADNLSKSGCWCTKADVKAAAHHIIPRRSGGTVGKDLRDCLKNKRHVDMDSAINGVCLPMSDEAKSSAFLHKGNEGILHSKRIKGLLDLCKDDSLSNDQFIDKLREIAEGYTKGELIIP